MSGSLTGLAAHPRSRPCPIDSHENETGTTDSGTSSRIDVTGASGSSPMLQCFQQSGLMHIHIPCARLMPVGAAIPSLGFAKSSHHYCTVAPAYDNLCVRSFCHGELRSRNVLISHRLCPKWRSRRGIPAGQGSESLAETCQPS